VVITFDDGFQEAVEHAVPILQTQGFTAIFFLVAGLVGQHSLWLDHELGCTFPLLEWSTARQLERDGFPCGAHSWRHPRLTDVAADECLGELIDSRKLLEDELGHPVRHLAYPYGAYSATVRTSAITAGYRTACSTRRGASPPTDDPWALPRVSIYGSDNRLDFVCRLHTARSGRELLRQALQRATQHPMPRSKELPQSSC
jgi:peptidoglycan/xylan/chitin deacetylase (PgdA/CDA1 family)